MAELRELYERQRHALFPRGSLPEGYRDLYAEWVELDGFVAGLAQRALNGEVLGRDELEPKGHRAFQARLDKFSKDFPAISVPFLDAFQRLNRMLELMRKLAT